MSKNLGSQFLGAFIRQIGREAAHSAYRSAKEEAVEKVEELSGIETFPSVSNYVKLLFAQIILFIGPILGLCKGLSRLFGKNMIVYGVMDTKVYKKDRNYSNGERLIERENHRIRITQSKNKFDPKKVSIFHKHAIAYIIISIISLTIHISIIQNAEKEEKLEAQKLETLTSWNTVKITDEFTGETTSYDMLYSIYNSSPNEDVVLLKESNQYYLLGKNSYNFDVDFLDNSTQVEIRTAKGAVKRKLKVYEQENISLLNPLNKKVSFYYKFKMPSKEIPSNSKMKIRIKGEVYTFNTERKSN